MYACVNGNIVFAHDCCSICSYYIFFRYSCLVFAMGFRNGRKIKSLWEKKWEFKCNVWFYLLFNFKLIPWFYGFYYWKVEKRNFFSHEKLFSPNLLNFTRFFFYLSELIYFTHSKKELILDSREKKLEKLVCS